MENLTPETKVFKSGGILFGACGTAADMQVLRHRFTPPKYNGGNLGRFVVGELVPGIWEALKTAGRLMEKDSVQTMESTFMIGIAGSLFKLDYVGGCTQEWNPYMTIGCGEEYATGSMSTLEAYVLHPRKRIKMALENTAKHCPGVAAPFYVKSI